MQIMYRMVRRNVRSDPLQENRFILFMVYSDLQYKRYKMRFKTLVFLIVVSNAYLETKLEGGVFDGQYITTIYVGTPPQPRKVSIDTGSDYLTINCYQCANCLTNHPNENFNRAKSSSQKFVGCSRQNYYCNRCNQNTDKECQYEIAYYDKSYTSGIIFQDVISITGDSSAGVRQMIGCVTNASTAFAEDTKLDGLWGLGRGEKASSGTYFRADKYITEVSKKFGVNKMLSICLSFLGGKMIIGGQDNSIHTLPPITFNYNNLETEIFSNSLGRVRVGQKIVHEDGGKVMQDIIIDSGASSSILSPQLHEQVVKSMQSTCKTLDIQCKWYGKDVPGSKGDVYCLQLTDSLYLRNFSDIVLTLGGQDVRWKATEYLLLNEENTLNFCFVAIPSTSSNLLGNDFMINKDIIYGQTAITIYPQSNCGGRPAPYGQRQQQFNQNNSNQNSTNQASPSDQQPTQQPSDSSNNLPSQNKTPSFYTQDVSSDRQPTQQPSDSSNNLPSQNNIPQNQAPSFYTQVVSSDSQAPPAVQISISSQQQLNLRQNASLEDSSSSKAVIVLGITIAVIIVLGLAVFTILYCKKKRAIAGQAKEKNLENEFPAPVTDVRLPLQNEIPAS